jgi:hypothetical protein
MLGTENVLHGMVDASLSVEDTVELALVGRGIEPLRVRVGVMARMSSGHRDRRRAARRSEPLPVLIG